VGVPSTKKGITRRGAGGLVTLFLRLVAPASRAAIIARGESWLMTGIKRCDYVGRLGIASLDTMTSLTLSSS
jgi:hypothetical protein